MPTANKRLRLDGLIRVSQRGGRSDEDLRSPDQQREIIERHAAGISADVHFHPDAIDVSGKTMDRADIALVLERIRSKKTDGLIVAYTSRFSRARVDEALAVKAAVEEAGGRLVVCDIGGIDLDTNAGELMFTNMLAMARFQWRETADRFAISRKNAVARGKAVGGLKWGYRFTDPTKKAGGRGVADSRLLVDERLRPVVHELFERKAGGATWLELARWLDENDPKPDGKLWSRQSVNSIIKSRTYLGEVFHGEHRNPDAHEPLVSPSLWRRAQNEPGRKTPRGTYLLTGIVRCAGCGRTMKGTSHGRGRNKERRIRIYQCDTNGCPSKSTIMCDRLDQEVALRLTDHTIETTDPDGVDDTELAEARLEVQRLTLAVETAASYVPTHPNALAAYQESVEAAERDLRDAEARLDALESRTSGSFDAFRRAWTEWESASPDERTRRLAEAEAHMDEDPESYEHDLTLEELQRHLRQAVDTVLIRKSKGSGPASDIPYRVLVLPRGEAPDGMLDRAAPITTWTWKDDAASLQRHP